MNILDHGYLKYIEHWGSDERIIEAARMSTSKGFLGWGPKPCLNCKNLDVTSSSRDPDYVCQVCKNACLVEGDEKLLRYLWEHKHTTPFEMAGMTIEVQAPIMVFREWHRHRTQSYNEMSARYIPLPDVNYVPTVERLMMNSKTNKQAGTIKGADELTEEMAERFQSALVNMYQSQQTTNKYLKENYPDYWALCLDADEVVDDRLKDFLPKLQELTDEDIITIHMRHLIYTLNQEDATRNIHFVHNRLFKVNEKLQYPNGEHPVLYSKSPNVKYLNTNYFTIWHCGYINGIFDIRKKYLNIISASKA